MKKLYFLAISVLALASCSHDLGDYDESIRRRRRKTRFRTGNQSQC